MPNQSSIFFGDAMQHTLHYAGREAVVLPDRSQVTGPQCEHVAARVLIEEGWAEPEDQLAFYRDGKPSLSGTVHAFASKSVSEATGVCVFAPWSPHPRTKLGPLMRAYCRDYGIAYGTEEDDGDATQAA